MNKVQVNTPLNERIRNAAFVSKDASYIIEYKSEGVFLVVSPEEGEGQPVPPDFLLYDIDRRGIRGINSVDLVVRLRKGEDCIKIADAQEEKPCDMDFMVKFAKEDMVATMMLFPPFAGGAEKDEETVLSLINSKWKVTHGIKEENIREAVKYKRYFKQMPIAAGKEPVKGKDGYITFLFKTDHSYAPKQMADGTADYKNLDLFESVRENDVLVTAIPPEDGIDGCTVKGKILPALKGKEAVLPKGKNVEVSEDGKSLIALKSGRVDYVNGKVQISDVFKVKDDVDMSVGNIDFAGDLIIQGNVNSGFTLKATGNIEVHGFVDASTLIAGKDIILKNGFQGNDKGTLKAGGNIVARFIERGKVEAKENLFADYIVNCTVIAGGNITMQGKHGKIIGGLVRAGKEITAKSVGSASGEVTTLEVGISPELRVKLADLETKRIQTKGQIDKMDNLTRVLPSASTESEERLAMRQKLLDTRQMLTENYNEILNEIEMLKFRLSELSGGKIHILSSAYPDVRITIDSSIYSIKTLMEYVTFKHREGEIVFTSCEAKN